MSRYKRGDVVIAPITFIDRDGLLTYKTRPLIVIDVEDDTDNITVSCTTQLRQSENFTGILVKKNSPEHRSMNLGESTFIYCNKTITLSNSDIKRRIGNCPKALI